MGDRFVLGDEGAIAGFSNLSGLPSISGFVVKELIQNAQNKQEVNQVLGASQVCAK